MRTNANADAWSIGTLHPGPTGPIAKAEADLFYSDFVERVAEGLKMTRRRGRRCAGRVWTGADALDRGLVDELSGLRTCGARRAKVLAGLDEDTEVRIVSYPGVTLGHGATASVITTGSGIAAGC